MLAIPIAGDRHHPWQDIEADQPLATDAGRAGGLGGDDRVERLGAPRPQIPH